jgi:DNA-binding FadR family transcriptional regulator
VNRSSEAVAAAEQLRAHIRKHKLRSGDRLPAERDLAILLGLSRGRLRQALASAEAAGEIRRHVGQGTFIADLVPRTEEDLAARLAGKSNPLEVLETRALLEPRLASLAALRGSPQAFKNLVAIVRDGLAARDAATSHRLGNEFHQAIANMAGNQLMLGLFEAVFQVRERNTWGKLRPSASTLEELRGLWQQHQAIAQAIISRDVREAEALMRQHIDELHRAISGQDARLTSPVGATGWLAGLGAL